MVLEPLSLTLGARINEHKSASILASLHPKHTTWRKEESLKWIPLSEGVQYLGIFIGHHLPE